MGPACNLQPGWIISLLRWDTAVFSVLLVTALLQSSQNTSIILTFMIVALGNSVSCTNGLMIAGRSRDCCLGSANTRCGGIAVQEAGTRAAVVYRRRGVIIVTSSTVTTLCRFLLITRTRRDQRRSGAGRALWLHLSTSPPSVRSRKRAPPRSIISYTPPFYWRMPFSRKTPIKPQVDGIRKAQGAFKDHAFCQKRQKTDWETEKCCKRDTYRGIWDNQRFE